jgi:hypothetical protein
MRSLTCLALVLATLVGITACGGSSSSEGVPDYCRGKVEVVLWGGIQWQELAEALARDRSECAEYYISIPPQDADHTLLRSRGTFKKLRALDPNIHPVAEIRFTGETGWRDWVVGAPGRTFYEAGVEARRRMAQRRLDVADGEIWALNELAPEVRGNVSGRRAEIREFLRGLYEGESGMPKTRGIVFDIGARYDLRDATSYKARLEAWFADEPFWSDLDTYVDFFAEEVYAGPLAWGVADAPLATRVAYLNDYLFHMTTLVEPGPESVEAARKFLRRTYVPLANAAWPHPGIGHTDLISADTMSRFVSTEVYAIQRHAEAHADGAPQGRIGFGWAPNPADPGYSEDGRDMILTRLASALHAMAGQRNSQAGPCGRPGENLWCNGEVEGAFLNDAWKIFASWN